MSQTHTLSAEQIASLTSRDIDVMSSDDYKVHVTTNPVFVARVNELAANEPRKPIGR